MFKRCPNCIGTSSAVARRPWRDRMTLGNCPGCGHAYVMEPGATTTFGKVFTVMVLLAAAVLIGAIMYWGRSSSV